MIYLDNAATTPVDREVLEKMLPFFLRDFANPSSIYSKGVEAKKAINEAREIIAETIGAASREIYFTSGGSEGNNLALKSVCGNYGEKGRHVIVSAIEHPSVLETAKWLTKNGFRVSFAAVDKYGRVTPQEIKRLIQEDTILVSVMMANNEVGTIQPIKEIGEMVREYGIIMHTDAVQAYGSIPINVNELNVDLLTASGHKIYGPKGVGFIYAKNSVKMDAQILGGGQEKGLRSGTENVPGIVGMAAAAKKACDNLRERYGKCARLRDILIKNVTEGVTECYLNGSAGDERLPGNVNLSFNGIEGESLVITLDMKGIAISSGSACSQQKEEVSHVLSAMGLSENLARGSVRISIGHKNTDAEILQVSKAIIEGVERLRKIRI